MRCIFEIVDQNVLDVDVRDAQRGQRMVMPLVHRGKEVEIGGWSPKVDPYGPAMLTRTLGQLARAARPAASQRARPATSCPRRSSSVRPLLEERRQAPIIDEGGFGCDDEEVDVRERVGRMIRARL